MKKGCSPAFSASEIDSVWKVVKLGDSGGGMTSSGRHSCEFFDDAKGKEEDWVRLGGDSKTVVGKCLLAVESLEIGRSRSDWLSGMGE